MRDWGGIPTEDDKLRARAVGAKYFGEPSSTVEFLLLIVVWSTTVSSFHLSRVVGEMLGRCLHTLSWSDSKVTRTCTCDDGCDESWMGFLGVY